MDQEIRHNDEIARLSEALASQVEYNNTLLTQLHSQDRPRSPPRSYGRTSPAPPPPTALATTTTSSGDHQRYGTSAFASSHRQSSPNPYLPRPSSASLAAPSTAMASTSGHNIYRQECDRLRVELDGVMQTNVRLKEENSRLQSRIQRFADEGAEVARRIRDFDGERRDLLGRIRDLEGSNRQSATAESHSQSLQEELNRCVDQMNAHKERANQAETRLLALSEAQRVGRDHEHSMFQRVQQLENQLHVKTEEVQRKTLQLEAREKEVEEIRAGLDQITLTSHSEKSSTEYEISNLKLKLEVAERELSAAKAQLNVQNSLKAQDGERRSEELERVRSHFELEAQAHVSSIQRQHTKLQQEHTELHDMLQKTRQEKVDAIRSLEQQKSAYDERVRQLESSLKELRDGNRTATREAEATSHQAIQQHKSATQELTQRTGGFHTFLASLQEQVRQIGLENAAMVKAYNEAHAHINEVDLQMRTNMKEDLETSERMLKDIKRVTLREATAFGDRHHIISAQLESTKLQLRNEQVQLEELKGKELMIRDELSAKDAEMKQMKAKLGTAEGLVQELAKDRNSVQTDLQGQLETTSAQRRQLQEDNDALTEELKEVQEKWLKRTQQLEAELASTKTQLEVLTEERDNLHAQRSRLEMDIERHKENQEELKGQVRVHSQTEASYEQMVTEVESMREQTNKLQHQLSQTNSLLVLVQQQRQEAVQEVLTLREKLKSHQALSQLSGKSTSSRGPLPPLPTENGAPTHQPQHQPQQQQQQQRVYQHQGIVSSQQQQHVMQMRGASYQQFHTNT